MGQKGGWFYGIMRARNEVEIGQGKKSGDILGDDVVVAREGGGHLSVCFCFVIYVRMDRLLALESCRGHFDLMVRQSNEAARQIVFVHVISLHP